MPKRSDINPKKEIMDIIKKPFKELDDFFGDEDWVFPIFKKGIFEPEMDVYEKGKDVVAEVSIPDINPEDIKVEVEDGVLKVSGSFQGKKEEGERGKNYWKKEIRKGSFQRAVRLPVDVNEEKTEATYEKGILRVVLPKSEQKKKKGKNIKVKAR